MKKIWSYLLQHKAATAIGVFILMLLAVFLPTFIVWVTGQGKSSFHSDDLSSAQVGIVLGTTPRVRGNDNQYFKHRMKAASDLYKAGKVECLLLSGANPSEYYNEPQEMKKALIALGVPQDVIVLDYAGLRTLDSVYRAQKIFGVKDAIFISQAFHNHRALFIADHIGMQASGYNAKDVSASYGMRTRLREVLARVKMFLDLHILNTQPKYLGAKESLPI